MASVPEQYEAHLKSGHFQLCQFAFECLHQWLKRFGPCYSKVLFKGKNEVPKDLPGFGHFISLIDPDGKFTITGTHIRTSEKNVIATAELIHGLAREFTLNRKYYLNFNEEISEFMHHPGGVAMYPAKLSQSTQVRVSSIIQIPVICFETVTRRENRILGYMRGHKSALIPAYNVVLTLHPYDSKEQQRLVGLIDNAFRISRSNLRTNFLKLDYELFVLRNYKEFKRIQENSNVDFESETLPSYWFDEFDEDMPVEAIMDSLAIEKTWARDRASNIRYLVHCGFPAGTMFLRTRCEAQMTTRGGGIEYIYLNDPNDKGRINFVSSARLELCPIN